MKMSGKKIREIGLLRFEKGTRIQDYYEAQWVHKRGHAIWVEVRAVLLKDTSPQKILANIVDITPRKKALLALEKSKEELRLQAINLEETNTALKVILKQRHKESEYLERNIQFNFENLVLPYLNELLHSQTDSPVPAMPKLPEYYQGQLKRDYSPASSHLCVPIRKAQPQTDPGYQFDPAGKNLPGDRRHSYGQQGRR